MPPPRRRLLPAEVDLVRWLLSHAARAGAGTAPDPVIEELLVKDRCDCGCPSVDFLVEGLAATATIAAEAEGMSPEGDPVGVILWVRSGRLSGLEVYALAGEGPVSLPLPATLHPTSRLIAE
jgi:hypothetical protein